MLRKEILSGQKAPNRKQKRLMKKNHAKRATAFVLAGLMVASSIVIPTGNSVFASDKLLAFSGAEGGGRYATGGRG